MPIVREVLENGKVRTYSASGMKIHGGFPEGDYDEVVESAEASHEYEETDVPAESQIVDENGCIPAGRLRNAATVIGNRLIDADSSIVEKAAALSAGTNDIAVVESVVASILRAVGIAQPAQSGSNE